jgi:hypothetical protein
MIVKLQSSELIAAIKKFYSTSAELQIDDFVVFVFLAS